MVEKVNGGDSGRKGEFTIVVFKTKVYIVYGWFGEEDEVREFLSKKYNF